MRTILYLKGSITLFLAKINNAILSKNGFFIYYQLILVFCFSLVLTNEVSAENEVAVVPTSTFFKKQFKNYFEAVVDNIIDNLETQGVQTHNWSSLSNSLPCVNDITNYEFDSGTTDWSLYLQSGNTATLSIDNSNQLSGPNAAMVNIALNSGTNWHIQLAQIGKSIIAGKSYVVSFEAKATANRSIDVRLQRRSAPWSNYWNQNLNLTTTPTTYTYSFVVDSTNISNVGLLFDFGASSENVWIDKVYFAESCNEICDNNIDDDGDGLTDCDDPDCTETPTNINCTSVCEGNNMGFESGFTDWTLLGSPTISSDVYAGTSSAYLNADAERVRQTINVEGDSLYQISFWAKGTVSGTDWAGVILRFFDSGGTYIGQLDIKTWGYSNWNRFFKVVVAPENAATMELELAVWGSSSNMYFDEICFQKSTYVIPIPNNSGCEIYSSSEGQSTFWFNNASGWIVNDLHEGAIISDNGDGSKTIRATLTNGKFEDVYPCGETDSWSIELQINNELTWAQWGGNYDNFGIVNNGCTDYHANWEYWDITSGTITGLGCNTGQVYTILGSVSGYKFQIGTGANRNGCNFGMAGWVEYDRNGVTETFDIYFDLDENCYTNPPVEICNNNIDDDGDGAIDGADPDCASCSSVLLSNGDFQNDLANWVDWNYSSIVTEGGNGNKYVTISGGEGGFGQDYATTAGEQFTLNFYGKKNGSELASGGFAFYDAGWTKIGTDYNRNITSSSFNLYSISATAPANTAWIQVYGWKTAGAGSADYDGFCLINAVEICDNNIDDDGDGAVDESDSDCLDGCTLTNLYPGFALDILDNNCSWLDYMLGNDLVLTDNGNGTITISGSIESAIDADWDACVTSTCGVNDAWSLNLTLSDKKNWTEWQAAGGTANVHTNCNGQTANLDYWDVSGTLTGLGCNAGRTITITGPSSTYRFQIGYGGNSGDSSCSFGLSTWFEAEENGYSINADIYAFLDENCYTNPTYEICGNGIDDDNDGLVDTDDPDCQKIVNGQVFIDNNEDGLNNDVGGGATDVTVYLYEDINQDGQLDGGDVLLDSQLTNASGDYSFILPEKVCIASDDFSDATWDGSTWDGGTGWASGWNDDYGESSGNLGPNLGTDGGEGWNVAILDCNQTNNHNNCEPYGTPKLSLENDDYISRRIDLSNYSSIDFTFDIETVANNDGDDKLTIKVCTDNSESNCYTLYTNGFNNGNFAQTPITVSATLNDPTYLIDDAYLFFHIEGFSGSAEYVYLGAVDICTTFRSISHLVISTDTTTVPTDYIYTTDNIETAVFLSSNGIDANNDFGIALNIEICDNNIDDDGDGLIDCEDPDCNPIPLAALSAGYKTIADGNWTSSSTWEGGNVPGTGTISGQVISIEHNVSLSGNNILLTNNSELYITNGSLSLSGGNLQIENGKTSLLNADYTSSSGSNIQITTANGAFYAKGGEVIVGHDFQNSGGIRNLENICLTVNENYQNNGGVDSLINVCLTSGVNASGDFQNNAGQIYTENSEFRNPNGNFQNQSGAILNGFGAIIWTENGNLQNNGTWNLPILQYCVAQQVTIPSSYLPNSEDCGTISTYFTPCDCSCDDPKEICGNGLDDDNNGLIDCNDPACAPVVFAGENETICSTDNILLTASATGGDGNYFYNWDNGLGNGSSHLVNPSVTTTYTVVVTDGGGCTDVDQITITVETCIEICDNNIDDDGDGLIDCADPDCNTVNITNLTFGNCVQVGYTFQSLMDVEVSWSNPPTGENLVVTVNGIDKTINITSGATSPATVQFSVSADNSEDNPIAINYSGGGACPLNATYNAPAPCPESVDRDTPCDNSTGNVGGVVFEDLNADGIQDPGEVGIEGVLVTAIDDLGSTVGQTTSNNIGVFQFGGLTDGEHIRLEFTTFPSGMYPTNAANNSGTTIQFVQIPSCTATLGLLDPNENPCTGSNSAILQNGYSIVGMLPGSDNVTLAIRDITQLGTLWQNAGNRNIDQSANVNTIRTWTNTDFEGEEIFSMTVDPRDGTIYAIASPFYATAPEMESFLFIQSTAPKVFKIDPISGLVTRIAQLNGSLGLGYIDFDVVNEQLLITNMDDGKIYRLATNGVLLSSFDPLVVDDAINGQLPTLGDRVVGVAFNPIEKRVYYSVWANHSTFIASDQRVNNNYNTIRSVGLDANGDFLTATDRLEISLPYALSDNNLTSPVGDIVFNKQTNRMLLAEMPIKQDNATGAIITNAHLATLKEYQLIAGTWTVEPAFSGNFEGKYDIGSQTYFKGRGSRGGADWAYQSVAGDVINGDENYVLSVGDALHFQLVEGNNIYGYQFIPTTGGDIANSILVDLNGDVTNAYKYAYGDVDIFKDYCSTPSLEIGNFVWLDTDDDGIQDANENGLPGVNVALYSNTGTLLATVVTDANGAYYFNDNTNGFAGLNPNTTYYLVVGTGGQFDTNTDLLNGLYNLTNSNIGQGINKDLNDSDATIGNAGAGDPPFVYDYPFVTVQTAGLGQNDHSFDIGFKNVCTTVIAVNDSLAICAGTDYEGSVAINDSNYFDKTFSVITQPNFGTVTVNADGTFEYLGGSTICTYDQFTYSVCDPTNICCDIATVYLDFSDTEKPSIQNVPENDTISCDEIIPVPTEVFVVDNCPGIALDIKEVDTQGEDGCSLYDYTITRTWTAMDLCGNTTVATQTVKVQDVVAPDIYRIYTLPNGKKMVAGVMEFVGKNWKTVNLPIDFPSKPIILHQVVTTNDLTPIVSQIRNTSISQFELRIKEEENNDNKHTRESIAWIAMEAGTQLTDYQLEIDTLSLTDANKALSFQNAFSSVPALFTSTQSTEEADPFMIRNQGLTINGSNLHIQEEASADAEIVHQQEKVGYLAIENIGNITDERGVLMGEVGTAMVNNTWKTISLANTYHNPVVIANSLSKSNGEAATVRVRNVGLNDFQIRVEEWDYLDGNHPNETVSFMVIEGSIPLESPTYCDNGTDSLEVGIDFKAVDNCDVSVVINYTEKDTFYGATKMITRTWAAEDECGNATSYTQTITCEGVSLRLQSILQGAMIGNSGNGLMRDDLRLKGLLPIQEPYSEMDRFQHVGSGGGEVMDTALLNINGANGIVDWVFLELRANNNVDSVVATKACLIQCDGDVVSVKGDTTLQFVNTQVGSYFVAIRHRNHIGMISLNPYSFTPNSFTPVNFTAEFTPVQGSYASVEMDNMESLWSGDLNGDRKVIYQGPNNDIFHMFISVLQDEKNKDFLPNYIRRAYTVEDFNLDGKVIYQGPNNDRALLLFSTILTHPQNPQKFSNFIIYTDND